MGLIRKSWFIYGLLTSIILIGVVVRFYKLGEVPYGYAPDEAAITYDAWSISLWHRDQFAKFLPLTFKSFGDYKPPVLIYLLASIFSVTGLIIPTTRYVSAVAGVGSIIISFFLARELFNEKKNSAWYGLICASVVAFSPWSIQLSRVGFEQNLTFFLGITGFWLYVKSLHKQIYLVPSFLTMALSCYTFHTAKIFIPLMFLATSWYFRTLTIKKIIPFILKVVLLVILLSPLLLTSNANARGHVLIFYNNQGKLDTIFTITITFIKNLWAQISPAFLVNGYDAVSIRHAVPGYGVLLWPSYVLLLIAFVYLFVSRNRRTLFLWLIFGIGILPGIIGQSAPHVIRSQFGLLGAALLISGSIMQIQQLVRPKLMVLISAIIIVATGINLYVYLHEYFNTYAIKSATAYGYGYQQILSVTSHYPSLSCVITDKYEQPYIYTLLYNRITPQQFLWGALNKYQFRAIHWPEAPGKLYLGTPQEIPPNDPTVVATITIPHTNQVVWVVAKP